MTKAIEINDLVLNYRVNTGRLLTFFDGADINVGQGEVICLTGESGSGKSSLLKVIGTLLRPTSGHYLLWGNDVSAMSDAERAKTRLDNMGFMFQDYMLTEYHTAYENTIVPLIFSDVPSRRIDVMANDALRAANAMEYKDKKVSKLSGGEKQRVSLARAVVKDPSLLLIDEPFNSLDVHNRDLFMELFRSLKNGKRTMIITSHDDTVKQICDRTIMIRDHRLYEA